MQIIIIRAPVFMVLRMENSDLKFHAPKRYSNKNSIKMLKFFYFIDFFFFEFHPQVQILFLNSVLNLKHINIVTNWTSLIDGSSKISENPIYENWQQCKSYNWNFLPFDWRSYGLYTVLFASLTWTVFMLKW